MDEYEWLKAKLEFASFYSYRMPGLSSQYALISPVPSPAALRLALVDAAIQHTGSPEYGRRIFDIVKDAPLWVIPPNQLCIMKFFVKRLKKPKKADSTLVPSTGIREYCHLDGPLEVYIQVSRSDLRKVATLFTYLRRLGTTDSILTAKAEAGEGPPPELCWKSLTQLNMPVSQFNYQRRLVVRLNDLRPGVDYDEVNPYSEVRKREPYSTYTFLLPLVQERRGENWTLYRRQPFNLVP